MQEDMNKVTYPGWPLLIYTYSGVLSSPYTPQYSATLSIWLLDHHRGSIHKLATSTLPKCLKVQLRLSQLVKPHPLVRP